MSQSRPASIDKFNREFNELKKETDTIIKEIGSINNFNEMNMLLFIRRLDAFVTKADGKLNSQWGELAEVFQEQRNQGSLAKEIEENYYLCEQQFYKIQQLKTELSRVYNMEPNSPQQQQNGKKKIEDFKDQQKNTPYAKEKFNFEVNQLINDLKKIKDSLDNDPRSFEDKIQYLEDNLPHIQKKIDDLNSLDKDFKGALDQTTRNNFMEFKKDYEELVNKKKEFENRISNGFNKGVDILIKDLNALDATLRLDALKNPEYSTLKYFEDTINTLNRFYKDQNIRGVLDNESIRKFENCVNEYNALKNRIRTENSPPIQQQQTEEQLRRQQIQQQQQALMDKHKEILKSQQQKPRQTVDSTSPAPITSNSIYESSGKKAQELASDIQKSLEEKKPNNNEKKSWMNKKLTKAQDHLIRARNFLGNLVQSEKNKNVTDKKTENENINNKLK